jgi:hypothetical protein
MRMRSYGPSDQLRMSRLPPAKRNADKKERQQKLRLHLLAVQREQEKLGWLRCSACLQVKALNDQWTKNGWPADFPYAVAVLCGEEGYLAEGEDFKPNQSAATEAKTGCIRSQWGLNNL